jgi:hypothetical protein
VRGLAVATDDLKKRRALRNKGNAIVKAKKKILSEEILQKSCGELWLWFSQKRLSFGSAAREEMGPTAI